MNLISNNKKAGHDFSLLEKFEAGIVLQGTEVKSLRLGKCSISEAFINIKNGEAWLIGATIAHYSHGNRENHEEQRQRKLLLHKSEIKKIEMEIKTQKVSVVPTKIYFSKGKVKVEFSLAKGKKKFDKRQDEVKKSVERKLRNKNYED